MILLALAALSQAGEPPQWTLQVDPLTTAIGYVHLQVERTAGDTVSVYAGPHLRLFSAPGSEPEPYLGYGAELGVRYYPKHTAPEGWWVLARGVLAHVRATDSDATAVGGYASVLGGYTGIIGPRLVLSGGLGIQRIQYGVGDYGIRTWFPAMHSTIGVAF